MPGNPKTLGRFKKSLDFMEGVVFGISVRVVIQLDLFHVLKWIVLFVEVGLVLKELVERRFI